MKTGILSITLLLFLPVAVAAQTADEIVKKVLDARGGVEKIKTIQSERVSGHVSFPRGMEGTFVVELKRPLKMHAEISVEGQKIIRVYDGKSSGWMINPFAEVKDAEPLSREDLKNISDESDFDGPLVDYKTKGNQIELVGKENLDDKPVYRLKLTNKNGDVRFYFFDASSFLLLKWEGIRKTGEQEVPWESFFSDFREVQGLKYAFRIDQGSPGTEIKQTLTAEKIEINPQIDDSRFAKPGPRDGSAAPALPAPASPPPSKYLSHAERCFSLLGKLTASFSKPGVSNAGGIDLRWNR
jgi:outer membrane lipoprotein-sorting protein